MHNNIISLQSIDLTLILHIHKYRMLLAHQPSLYHPPPTNNYVVCVCVVCSWLYASINMGGVTTVECNHCSCFHSFSDGQRTTPWVIYAECVTLTWCIYISVQTTTPLASPAVTHNTTHPRCHPAWRATWTITISISCSACLSRPSCQTPGHYIYAHYANGWSVHSQARGARV